MKSINLLLISFTITFVTLTTISPANANSTVKVQHLNVSNTLISNLSSSYRNNLSTSLFLSTPTILSEKDAQMTMDIVNKSNDFFTSAMVFNDKLHQLISYFTTSSNESITESVISTSETKIIKKKCGSKLSFS